MPNLWEALLRYFHYGDILGELSGLKVTVEHVSSIVKDLECRPMKYELFTPLDFIHRKKFVLTLILPFTSNCHW
jgi:hypothetical protein